MSHLGEEENSLALPAGLARAIRTAATAGQEGNSPPPSRPAPAQLGGKRRRQFKSTEGLARSRSLKDPPDTDDNEQSGQDGMIAGSPPPEPAAGGGGSSRRRPQTASKSGWGEDSGRPSVGEQKETSESRTGAGGGGRRAGRRAREMESRSDLSTTGGSSAPDLDEDDNDDDGSKAASPRGSQSRFGKKDAGIVIIPDLEDAEDDELVTSLAAAPSVKVNKVRAFRDLDADLASSTGILSEGSTGGIDLSRLCALALYPPDQVFEDDRPWDFDVILTELASDLDAAITVVGGRMREGAAEAGAPGAAAAAVELRRPPLAVAGGLSGSVRGALPA
ncbi:Intraflagellar transport protein 43 [Cladochytrium tenue]|nr:Intraflagellar transport protein 43 [Cladochytrium tenue]